MVNAAIRFFLPAAAKAKNSTTQLPRSVIHFITNADHDVFTFLKKVGCGFTTPRARVGVVNHALHGVLFVILLVTGAVAADPPSTQPAAVPPGNTSPQTDRQERQDRRSRRDRGSRNRSNAAALAPGTDPYDILQIRSIFVKGNQNIARDNGAQRGGSSGSAVANKPEAALVFNGVIMVGDEANAMIEDTGSNTTTLVHAGDAIAAGKVSSVTFDDLAYEAKGGVKHVQLGQNLAGDIPTASAASTQPGGGPPAGGPSGPGAAPLPGGSSPEDILARMRAKRNQELGIK